jgi:hypothetical protein
VLLTAGLFSQMVSADPTTKPTTAVVGGGGAAPNIECKWELPDMNPTIAGFQYNNDDDTTVRPDADNDGTNGIQAPCAIRTGDTPDMPNDVRHMIQVRPNIGDVPVKRAIQLWMAVDHSDGLANLNNVFWRITYPDDETQKGPKIVGTAVPAGVNGDCTDFGAGSGPEGSMFKEAVDTGQITAAAVDDVNKGMVAKCIQNEKQFFFGEFLLNKIQPCGEYKIEAVAVDDDGDTTIMTNYIDIVCIFSLTTDFSTVDWGTIDPPNGDQVSGDFLFDPPSDNNPTVKNLGNDGMGIGVRFTPMTGKTQGQVINVFDACFGKTLATLACIDPIPANTDTSFDDLEHDILCSNEVGKLDLSIHPSAGLPADTYNGQMTVFAFAAAEPDGCDAAPIGGAGQ